MSHSEYTANSTTDTEQIDGQTSDRYITLTNRHGQNNKPNYCSSSQPKMKTINVTAVLSGFSFQYFNTVSFWMTTRLQQLPVSPHVLFHSRWKKRVNGAMSYQV